MLLDCLGDHHGNPAGCVGDPDREEGVLRNFRAERERDEDLLMRGESGAGPTPTGP